MDPKIQVWPFAPPGTLRCTVVPPGLLGKNGNRWLPSHDYVCVCVFVSSVLATIPLVKARRVLHFAVYLNRGLHLFSVFFCPTI